MMMKANSCCTATIAPQIYGMIDANAYHICPATWPVPLAYVHIDAVDDRELVHFIDRNAAMDKLMSVDGKQVRYMMTAEMGGFLVKLNSAMYNTERTHTPEDYKKLAQIREEIKELLNGRNRASIKNKEELRQLNDLEKKEQRLKAAMTDIYRKDIPSLVIAPTMDMEFAHIGGYDGEFIYQQNEDTGKYFYKKYGQYPVYLSNDDELMFQTWSCQISNMVAAVEFNPYRLLPLFSYDPRRYRLSEHEKGKKGLGTWKEPFKRIAGHSDSHEDVKKVWLGFCMNPALGFRPFDEFCEHLPRFYKECEENNIPILAHCAPGGITTHDAGYYSDNVNERTKKNKERHEMILQERLSTCENDDLCSNRYYGKEPVVIGNEYMRLNDFYMDYGHPKNWVPVLEYFPDLRLCLSGFGGNSEWQFVGSSDKNAPAPTREWIQCIVKLTAKYKNVYADIAGLNIYDEKIRYGFLKMLYLIQDKENTEFAHLKHKLIFGSGWYLTSLTGVSGGGTGVDGKNIRHSYSNYCHEFKNLFYAADKGGNGELWKHVSLTNPWHFYALCEDKINKIHDESLK
jgi:predicted TIM-barrel fold metal-dependent hydrolase